MSSSLTNAIGELLRPQTLRIHYLPGLPAEFYTATAPCLLAQLADALASNTDGHGGGSATGSRVPMNTDAWDLWVEITYNVNGWADYLGLDRKPYAGPPKPTLRPVAERQPEWMRRLGPYLGRLSPLDGPGDVPPPSRDDLPVDVAPVAPAAPLYALPAETTEPFAATGIPPLGLLMRAVAAEAISQGQTAIQARLERKAGQWATRIRTLLAVARYDERVYPQRGVPCGSCGESVAFEIRDDGDTYRVPAIVAWFASPEGGDRDDLWLYQQCRACRDEGWVDYTTETGQDVFSDVA